MQAETEVPASSDPFRVGGADLLVPVLGYVHAKAVADVFLGVVLLILLLPVIALLLLLVKCTSRGPALYCQTRMGRDRQTFTLYKIRSMYHDCERHTGPKWASTDDPRVTPLGRFLRKTHLDELPQLWNVIRGEMSLVGPRPERPEFVEQLERVIPDYAQRLAIRPGVTGLAQVQLPPDSDLQSVRRKVTCDLFYIRNMNPLLDLQILLATATKVFGVPCESSCSLLGVPSEADIRVSRDAAAPNLGTESRCLVEPV